MLPCDLAPLGPVICPPERFELGAFEEVGLPEPPVPGGRVARVLFGCMGPPSLIDTYLPFCDAFCAWEGLPLFCEAFCAWEGLSLFCPDAVC